MKILSISAQKPNSTGSGIYMTELIKAFNSMGHQQAVIAGINSGDCPEFPDNVEFFPVVFNSETIPFPVCGMSDEMPYESTRYKDLTESMRLTFQDAFSQVVSKAVSDFEPDLIICHHLYLMTAAIRELFPDKRIMGICHNTDLRQLEKIPLARDYIIKNINNLDSILALHKAQKDKILNMFNCPESKIRVIGSGYNSDIFHEGVNSYQKHKDVMPEQEEEVIHVAYAGKIAIKKGVLSLINCSLQLKSFLGPQGPELVFHLAGSAGNAEEYNIITEAASKGAFKFEFTGALPQNELAKVYQSCQLFVLPSFYEGLPLTPVEAMACGCRAVITETPGVKDWLDENVPHARVSYVPLPKMRNVDEPLEDSLPDFENNLASAIKDAIFALSVEDRKKTDLFKITWSGLAARILS